MVKPAARLEPTNTLGEGADTRENVSIVVGQVVRRSPEFSIMPETLDHVTDGRRITKPDVYDVQHDLMSPPSFTDEL